MCTTRAHERKGGESHRVTGCMFSRSILLCSESRDNHVSAGGRYAVAKSYQDLTGSLS